jgi:hypothetical protein
LPLIGNFVFLLLILALVATGLYLWRTGRLPLGNLGRARPEEEAKRILAERFARGRYQLPMSSWSGPAS